tara:strand:- start:4619 stop:5596 length:978 start_codon:yes stop_codon:yes gene_type:complete
MSAKTLLIGDIGGTNARFALADPNIASFRNALTLQCAEFPSADDAIRHYLKTVAADTPDVICLAAAGPVVNDTIQVTNNHWTLSVRNIAEDFRIAAVRLINDFEALAYSIAELSPEHVEPIGQPQQAPLSGDRFNVAVVGPGTGLGTAGLIRRGAAVYPIVGEGGHIGFAPQSPRQIEILEVLRDKFGRVSVERLVSGTGIENIYWALTQIHGEQHAALSAAEIFANSGDGGDPRATETTQLFFELLGQAAGDVALALGAADGVFIAGGIAKRYPEMLRSSGFRQAFENKGRHRAYMERIASSLITHAEPGLLGAAYCARELSSS